MKENLKTKEVIKKYLKEDHVPVVLFDRGRANISLINDKKGLTYSMGCFLCEGINSNYLNKNLNIENKDKFSLYIEKKLLLRMLSFQREKEKDFSLQMIFYFNFENRSSLHKIDNFSFEGESKIFEIENIEKEVYVNGIKFIATLNGFAGYKYYAKVNLEDFIGHINSKEYFNAIEGT